jgi:hypothetical protein
VRNLKHCWAAVAHNSSPTVGAAIEGIPVFVTDPARSQCRDIANTDLSQIENPCHARSYSLVTTYKPVSLEPRRLNVGPLLVTHAGNGQEMKQLQLLASDYQDDTFIQEWVDNWLATRSGMTVCNDWQSVDANVPVFCYADLTRKHVPTWLKISNLLFILAADILATTATRKECFIVPV